MPGTGTCGFNGRGVPVLVCSNGVFVDGGTCMDPDACTDGTTQPGMTACGLNDRGFLDEVCNAGRWQDSTTCVDPDECTDDETRVGMTPCGLFGRGGLAQQCTLGTWLDGTACVDPDACTGVSCGERPDGGAWFVDAGVTASGIPVVTNVGDRPAPTPPVPVAVVREFYCEPAQGEMPMLAFGNELLVIRPTAVAPCTFDLFHRDGAGTDTALSTSPGGFLMAAVGTEGGTTVACVSDVQHQRDSTGPIHSRVAQSVRVSCWVRAGGTWSAGMEVVPPDNMHAAWVVDVVPVSSTPGEFTLRWVRDATFQFLNTGDQGRPPTDGIWSTRLTVSGAGILTAGAPTQDSPSVRIRSSAAEWVPQPDEVERYAGIVTVDAGTCAAGCITDGGR